MVTIDLSQWLPDDWMASVGRCCLGGESVWDSHIGQSYFAAEVSELNIRGIWLDVKARLFLLLIFMHSFAFKFYLNVTVIYSQQAWSL